MAYDNTNTISVFVNDKQGNEKRPDYTGKVNVEGKEYSVSMWKRESQNGVKYLSGQIQEPRVKETQTEDIDDSINDIEF